MVQQTGKWQACKAYFLSNETKDIFIYNMLNSLVLSVKTWRSAETLP